MSVKIFDSEFDKFKHFATLYKARIYTLQDVHYFFLASGSFGAVYMVYYKHIFIRKLVNVSSKPDDLRNALAEVSELYYLKKFCSKYITCIYDMEITDLGMNQKQISIDSEFFGFSLETFMTKNRERLTAGDYMIIIIRLLEALDYLHHLGVVHRDIKPGNIVINPTTLGVKFIDFGVSCLLDTDKANEALSMDPLLPKFTPKDIDECIQTIRGSPLYMSPELFANKVKTFDQWKNSDIWSLAMTFYWFIVGNTPFTGKSLLGLVYDQRERLDHFKTVGAMLDHEQKFRKSHSKEPDDLFFLALMPSIIDQMSTFDPSKRSSPAKLANHIKKLSFKMVAGIDFTDYDEKTYQLWTESYINSRKPDSFVSKDTLILADDKGLASTVSNSEKFQTELEAVQLKLGSRSRSSGIWTF